MGKGSSTTTNQTTSSADPQAAALYRQLLGQAQGVASTPYQAYSGELTAPINSQQQTGINNINSSAGFAQPYIQQAAGMVSNSANPLTSQQIQQYQNPYQQQVIDATVAQAQQNNAQQQAALKGNQISNGALGGNRAGVAQANLAAQQGTALNSQIAGLNSQNYTQALSTAQQQFQANPQTAAYSLGNLGVSGQNAALTGANAQIGAGTLQQTSQQAADTANYGQYQQAQAYPYQQLQWLAGLGTGVGSQLGGTSNGSTTTPPPNPWGQILGAGLTAASFLKDGGAVMPRRGFADGGVPAMPWGGAQGWIPAMQIARGSGAPHGSAPGVAQQQGGADPFKQAQAMLGVSDGLRARFSPESYGGGSPLDGDESAYGGSSKSPLPGLSAADYGTGFAFGGAPVRGFASGGSPTDFMSLTNGDPAWADPDIGPGYAMPGPSSQTPFEARGGFGELPPAKFDANFIRAYQEADPTGRDPRIDKALTDNAVPLPRARPEEAPVMAADDDAEPASAASRAPVRGFAPDPTSMVPPVPANQNVPAEATRAAANGDGGGFGGFGVAKALGFDVSPAARTGLLAAGLGMLASRSSNFGNVVGEGGGHGLNAYQGVKTAEAKQDMDNRKLEQESSKLAQEADRAAKELALRTRAQTETERSHKVAENEAPEGYEYNDDGSLRVVKGGPKDPDTIRAQSDAKQGPGLDDETVEMLANRVRAGDIRALTGLGRGAQGARDIAKVQASVARQAKEGAPVSPEAYKILQNAAQQGGLMAAERTQAQAMAKLTIYGRSAVNAMDYAEKLSEDVPRSQFVPVNKMINAWKTNTGDPKIAALGQGLETLTNEYARAIGGGHGTVADKEHARERLNTAQTPEQLKAIISVMRNEILLAHDAMPAARQEVREIYAPTGGKSTTPAGTNMTQPKGRVVQNGWIYEAGPDGKMVAVGRAP